MMNQQNAKIPKRAAWHRTYQTAATATMAVILGGTMVVRASEPDWGRRAREIATERLQAADRVSSTQEPSFKLSPTNETSVRVRPANEVAAHRRPFIEEPVTFRLAADTVPQSAPSDENGQSTSLTTTPPAASAESDSLSRGPLPGFFETIERDIKEAPELLWHDTKKVFGNPGNLIFLVGAGGASLALRFEVDDDIEDYYDRHHSFKEDWRDAFGVVGNPATHFGVALLWYAVGQQAQDAKTYEVGKRAISALAITGMTTMMLKICANTDSPNGESLAWPSGHVSSTMALATVLNDAYGPLVGVPMFGLTGLAAVERLDDGEHHFSDVVFGAALGWVVAETVMKEHRPEIFGGQVVPYADPANGNAGVAWIKTLGQ